MQILLNDEPIDVTLEAEETIGEVIDALADWLAESQCTITGITVDDIANPIGPHLGKANTPHLFSQPSRHCFLVL